MKRIQTTKSRITMLLALLALAWPTTWGSIKIYVRTEGNAANSAPYLYVWDETGELNGAFSNCQMSETTTSADGQTWYVKEFNKTSVNAIIHNNLGGAGNKTQDLIGIKEDRYYTYKGGSEYYNLTNQYIIPDNATYKDGNFVYFVNTSEWENPCIWVYDNSNNNYNTNGSWPGDRMEKVEGSVNLWLWQGTKSGTPTLIIFSNNGTNETGALAYTTGGYYNTVEKITTITQLQLNSTNFPDPNFRAALAEKLNVNEGDNIYPNNVRVLDVSGKGINNLTGIENFTNLEELYAGRNDISNNVILTNNTELRILDLNGNTQLKGTSPGHTPYIDLTKCKVLEELNFANTGCIWMGGLINIDGGGTYSNLKKVNLHNVGMDYMSSETMNKMPNLEWIDLSDNQLTNNQSFSNNTKLKYIDVSNNPQNSKSFNLSALTQLETFKARNCHLTSSALNSSSFGGATNLKYVDVSNNTAITTIYLTDKTNLLYLDMSGCTAFDYSSYISNCTKLEHLDISNNTAFKNTWWNNLNATNQPNLRYLNLSGTTGVTNSITSYTIEFPALDSLIINNNSTVTELTINTHSPSVIDITNDPNLATLGITNCGLTEMPSVTDLATTTALTKIDLTGNAFEAVPEVGGSVNTMVMNSNQLENIAVPSNIQYLYAQNNNFASEYSLPETSLVGLDLGNNGFTKFTAIKEGAITDEWAIDYTQTPPVTIQSNANESDGSNTTLQALHLGGNPNLENVTVNGYKGLTKLASGNDMTTAEGKGLYVKDNTALKTLDISNNHIEILGQDGSLSGLSGLETLNASHNKIMTLTNRSAITSRSNPRAAYGAGKYDASTCPNIEDLTGLKNLNLSYNLLSDSIHLWKNTALERLDVSHNRTITKRNAGETQYYRNTKDGTFAPWHHAAWKTEADQYTRDMNDTIGLRMLDLYRNVNLKYLDISYTNIENTAEDWTFVNNRVGPENLEPNASLGRWSVPRFVLVNHCPELVEFHSNYNAMKSLGVGRVPMSTSVCEVTGCPKLEVVEAIECRGQDPKIMQGEITISVHNPLIKYYNVSNSDFDKVNPYKVDGKEVSGQYLETLIIDGNYTRDKASSWSLSNASTLDVSHNPKLQNLQANKCPNLITVKANGLADLSVVSVKQDTTVTVNNEDVTTKLAELYVDHDAILNKVQGLETLSALSVYHANDSHFTGGFVMPTLAKLTLTDLRVGNETLALAETRNNLTAVDLTGYTAVKHLETQNNPSIATLNLAGFTGTLEHINFANNHIENNGIGIDEGTGSLPELPALKYFNCSNDSKWNSNTGNRLTDLVLTSSTGIKEIHANNNDLHRITGSFANLTNIEFAHNHINGIDLSAAANNNPKIKINAEDNGREITAECAKFYQNGQLNPTNEITVFFFQLNDINANGQTIDNSQPLASKTSEDSNGATRYLGKDGFNLSGGTNQLDAWSGTNAALYVPPTSPSGISPKDVTIDPSNMSQYLTGDVPGQIVVLKEDPDNPAEGRATYTYNTGAGNCEFYLDWNANADIPTAIKDITVDNNISIANSYGHLTVNGADGTVVNVYDMNGRQVANETISGGTATINGLASGIYIVNGNKVIIR